jgi:hypothetical protein
MSHTLTLHRLSNGQAWFSRNTSYGKQEIDAISDGQGGNTDQPPTSIPSPFARFDLVRTAFLRLSESKNGLTGEPNDERLVSACFDVGQLFFHIDEFSDRLSVIQWKKGTDADAESKKTSDLQTLLNSTSVGHQRLGKALQLFMDQDGGRAKPMNDGDKSGYNFRQMDSLFMLRYTGQGRSVMVGGTSPSTVFFNAPEDLSFMDVQFGNYRLFQPQNPSPLHKRNDPAYQKFWYGLLQQLGSAEVFPEVHEYLLKSLALLQQTDQKLWDEIGNNAGKLVGAAYDKLFLNLEPAEVLGYKIKKQKPDTTVLTASGFILKSEKFERLFPGEPLPMVLQDRYQGKLRYTRDPWNKTQAVPPFVAEDWRKRRLPGQPENYPWLTISDLLEPYIIRLVYPINQQRFYDAMPASRDLTQSFLLPLTPTFFDFFDVEDLYDETHARVRLTMQMLGHDSVEVTLEIPLAPGEPPIRFIRKYDGLSQSGQAQTPDPARNKGAVVQCQVGVNLMPFVRFETVSPHYNVQVVDRDIDVYTLKHDYRLGFRNRDNKTLVVAAPRQRSRKESGKPGSVTTTYYGLSENFDYITLETAPGSGQRGVVVPRFDMAKKEEGSDIFTVAVDFGTTNTHIEYITQADAEPKAFAFGPDDAPVATLHDPAFAQRDRSLNGTGAAALVDVIPIEWLPEKVGPDSRASFPTRTALLDNQPKWNQNLFAFQDFNPALLYEKQRLPVDKYVVTTNLKWAGDEQAETDPAQKRAIGYLESLLLLIRNKVLLNGGKLSDTKLVWFYPLSMTERRREFFSQEWSRLFASHISTVTHPQRIPESTAPYYWFQNRGKIAAVTHPAVSIDIGGGTSDVVVFGGQRDSDAPVLISSFRFAANAIFGDGFADRNGADQNGFVQRYGNRILPLLTSNQLTDLVNASKDIHDRKSSEDIVAFFFSLKDNREVQDKINIDFNQMLARDGEMKIVFLVFYTALIYHLARLMQGKGLAMPRYVAFSGNGSKVLNILSPRPAVLATLARLMFEKVYQQPYHADGLDVIIEEKNPKEATCKGGLKRSAELQFGQADTGDAAERIDALKAVLLGTRTDPAADPAEKPRFVTRADTYATIDEAALTSVADEVRHFIDLLATLDNDISLRDKFGINPDDVERYRQVLGKDLMQNIKIGLQAKQKGAKTPGPVEETLFFYPLIKGLNTLAWNIANNPS